MIKLSQGALVTLLAHAQHVARAKEAGGVLIGRHILDARDVVIDQVTRPSPADRRSRTSFHRARAPHQDALDDVWRESNGTSVYLGEWHTHPESSPVPSSVDLDDWRRRLRRDIVDADFLLFLIVGQRWIRMWEGCRTTFCVVALTEQRPECRQREGNHDGTD